MGKAQVPPDERAVYLLNPPYCYQRKPDYGQHRAPPLLTVLN
jgi:hypothetical protein